MMQIHSHEKANIDNYNAILATILAILGRRVRPRPLKDGFRAPPLSTLSNLQLNPYGICLSLPSLDLSKSPSIVLSAPPSAPSLLFQTPPAAWPPPSPGEIWHPPLKWGTGLELSLCMSSTISDTGWLSHWAAPQALACPSIYKGVQPGSQRISEPTSEDLLNNQPMLLPPDTASLQNSEALPPAKNIQNRPHW